MKTFILLFLSSILFFAIYSDKKNPYDELENYWVGKRAPELSEGDWINSSPLLLSQNRGKVILLEFWTFECHNCKNTLPFVIRWNKKFRQENFLTIGIHTPEFENEKVLNNVKAAVKKLRIEYPVVTDEDFATWYSYHQQFWPVMYLIDKKGIIRYMHIGEGNYGETEKKILELLNES